MLAEASAKREATRAIDAAREQQMQVDAHVVQRTAVTL